MAFLVSHPVTEFSPQQVDPGSRRPGPKKVCV